MKFKKILCLILTLMLTASAIGTMNVGAANTDGILTDKLIMHWNFEGDTLEEQLANKAPKGNPDDVLELRTNGITKIENGIATIGSEPVEQIAYFSKGNSLDECKDGFTLFLKAKVPTEGGWPNVYNLFWLQGSDIAQIRYIVDPLENNVLGARALGELSSGASPVLPGEMNWKLDEYTIIAISVRPDGDKFTYDIYCGPNLASQSYTVELDKYTDIINSNLEIVLTSGKMVNDIGSLHEKDSSYDDVRLYNRALTEKGVKAVVAEIEGKDLSEYSNAEELFYIKAADTEPPETTEEPTAEDETTKAPEATEADKKQDEVADEEGGCGSAIMGLVFIPVTMAVGAVAVSRKRKTK